MRDRASRNRAAALFVALAVAFTGIAVASAALAAPAAESLQERLAHANAAYTSGDFASAAREYETIRSSGVNSADLDLNLGNAYAKSGDLGRAVASFERARLRAPRDREILENLALVGERCADRPPAGFGSPGRFVASWATRLTPDEWIAILVLGYVGVLGTIVGPYFAPLSSAIWRRARNLAVAFLVVGGVGIGVWHSVNGPGRRCVVLAPEVTVRSGPDASYLGEFTLHSGSVLQVDGRREGWVKVRFSPSLRGWTEAEGLEIL